MQTTQSTCFPLCLTSQALLQFSRFVHSSVPRPLESVAISAGPDGTTAVLIVPPNVPSDPSQLTWCESSLLFFSISTIFLPLFVCPVAFLFRNSHPFLSICLTRSLSGNSLARQRVASGVLEHDCPPSHPLVSARTKLQLHK